MESKELIAEFKTDARVVADLVEEHIKPQFVTVEGYAGESIHGVVLPTGLRFESLEEHVEVARVRPRRRKGQALVTDLESFVSLTNRFKDDNSAIFADKNAAAPALVSVIDYHPIGTDADTEPRFGEHRVRYAFPLSDELLAWRASNAKAMTQDVFALFIEQRLVDVVPPETANELCKNFASTIGVSFATASDLLKYSHGLTVHAGHRAVHRVNPTTGEGELSFSEDHQDANGKPLRVPGAFLVGIPIFKGGIRYRLPVRLRYRVQQGAIGWTYELAHLDLACEIAINEACSIAAEKTGLPLYAGTPEK